MKTCNTCFNAGHLENPVCVSCVEYSKWVARDVFKNIDNHGQQMTMRVEGIKFDNDKPQWSLLPFKALKEVVDVLTYGAKKYAPDNWKKVPDARRRYIDAGFRHLTAYASGEKLDSETGKSHLAHAICCLLYLLAFEVGEDRG